MSSIHETSATEMIMAFSSAMVDQQEQVGNDKRLRWTVAGGLVSRLERTKSKFISDMTIQNRFGDALFIMEVVYTQSQCDVRSKIRRRFAKNPRLLGTCIIFILESPKFDNPKSDVTDGDRIVRSLWVEAVDESITGDIVGSGQSAAPSKFS